MAEPARLRIAMSVNGLSVLIHRLKFILFNSFKWAQPKTNNN